MIWPNNKDFAFSIIDDTDNATISNIKPVYDLLKKHKIFITKTVWIYPPKNSFTGETLKDPDYIKYVKDLKSQGFEIQLHNIGSGDFSRDEILKGLEYFKSVFDHYPSMQINHSTNSDNLYWGYKRYGSILKNIIKFLFNNKRSFYGDVVSSPYFWGDYSKKHIKYIRNRVFNGINTLKYDPKMPYKEKNKPYSNYWFSSSDGHTLNEFNQLLSPKNINKLKRQKGLCLIYTHFSSGFVDTEGNLDKTFKENIEFLSKQNAWIAPASEILDYLNKRNEIEYINDFYKNILDIKWLFNRIIKKIRYKL